jgi:glycosyltransferase involved in cell wall biosynthesis
MLGDEEAFLVEPENPLALAAAIRLALTNRDLAAAKAQRARQRLIDAFGVQQWLEQYESLYRAIQAPSATAKPAPRSPSSARGSMRTTPATGRV